MMISWMGIVAALLRPDDPLRNVGNATALITVFICLLAGSVETGSIETGRNSGARRPLQAAAVIAFLTHLAACAASYFFFSRS